MATTRPSAAIQIVKPPSGPVKVSAPTTTTLTGSQDGPTGGGGGGLNVNAATFGAAPPSPDRRKDTTQRLCRNVLIYGTCRFQDNGCVYYHPPPGVDPALLPTTPSALTTPTLKDSKALSSEIGAEHLSAPVFVPKTPMTDAISPETTAPSVTASERDQWPQMGSSGLLDTSSLNNQGHTFDAFGTAIDNPNLLFNPIRPTLDYHLYTSPLPHVTNPPITNNSLQSFFIPDDLRRMLTARHEATYATPSAPTGLPNELGAYHTLLPLDRPTLGPQGPRGRVWGHPSPIYRATSSVDGNIYALRRIEGFKLVNEQAFGTIDTWRRLRHANIVGVREAFTTKAFNDNSLIVVYDYFPESTNLWDEHLNPHPDQPQFGSGPRRRSGMPIQERLLWSYVTQIANAIKAIHVSGLSARGIDPTKVLITGKNRVRLNGCGITDVLAYDPSIPVSAHQQDDLVSFGKLLLWLGCEFFQPGQHPGVAIDHIARHYSPDYKNLILFLIAKPTPAKHIDEVIRLVGPRILNELDGMQSYVDVLESEMGAEVENGRIARLLIKLGFINERAEFELDPRWSDTGDRYILKLFRDYVFHSIAVDGSPILDLSHVLVCLNKLDSGLDEKIMLVSRDDQSCLVVSYREIKSCIEAAYGELRTAGTTRRMR